MDINLRPSESEYYHNITNKALTTKCCNDCIIKMCCNQICDNWLREIIEIASKDNKVSVEQTYRWIHNYIIDNKLILT